MATDRTNKDEGDSPQGKKPGDGMSMKERLLAQRRADEIAGAPKASSPPSRTPSSAPPVPAARPPAAGTARPQAAAPAPRPVETRRPVEAPAAAAAARSSTSAASQRSLPLSGAREQERAARREKKGVSPEVMREVELLRKQQDKWITYGWIAALGLMAIAGVVYFVVKGKHDAIIEADQAKAASIDNFIDKMKAFDPNKPSDIEQIIALTTDPANDPLWKVTDRDAHQKVSAIRATALRNLERQKSMKDLIEGLADLEAKAASAGSLPSEELAKARRRGAEYELQAGDLDDQTKIRISNARKALDQAFVAKLHDEAKALAAKGPAEARNALTAMQKAEDEAQRSLDDAIKMKKGDEVVDFYKTHYRELITESDVLVAQVFTPEVVEKTQWLDLLTDSQKDKWQKPGFKGWQLKDGVLHAVGPDLDSKQTAIMSIGDAEQWRDYVVEMEFVLVKGESDIHFRLGPRVDNTTVTIGLDTAGGAPFKTNQPNTITASMIGSNFKASYSDPERQGHDYPDMSWTTRRKGGIGASVPPGSEFKLTKMRVKVLR